MQRIARSVFSILGVTLLEIMLVLAIASMIIVMSVRYYQSATSSQQATAAVNQALAIATAMDSLSMAAGTYSSIGSNPGSSVKAYLGATSLTSPTGQPITVTGATASTYDVSIPLTPNVCSNVAAQLKGNAKITSPACNGGTLGYKYDKTKG